MKKIFLFVMLIMIGSGIFFFQNQEPRERRMTRLNTCISQKLPEIKSKYEAQGLKVGEPKIWID